jgi:hypothetical protein
VSNDLFYPKCFTVLIYWYDWIANLIVFIYLFICTRIRCHINHVFDKLSNDTYNFHFIIHRVYWFWWSFSKIFQSNRCQLWYVSINLNFYMLTLYYLFQRHTILFGTHRTQLKVSTYETINKIKINTSKAITSRWDWCSTFLTVSVAMPISLVLLLLTIQLNYQRKNEYDVDERRFLDSCNLSTWMIIVLQ